MNTRKAMIVRINMGQNATAYVVPSGLVPRILFIFAIKHWPEDRAMPNNQSDMLEEFYGTKGVAKYVTDACVTISDEELTSAYNGILKKRKATPAASNGKASTKIKQKPKALAGSR